MQPTFMRIAPEVLAHVLHLAEHDIRIGRVFTREDGAICAQLIGDGLPPGQVSATYTKHADGQVVLKAIEPA